MLAKAFVWELVIGCSSDVIARHNRSYGREEMVFNPLHYLAPSWLIPIPERSSKEHLRHNCLRRGHWQCDCG